MKRNNNEQKYIVAVFIMLAEKIFFCLISMMFL